MADQAKVSSLDAIADLRTSLVLFMERAGKALDEVADGVRRTRHWLQDEQPSYWRAQKKRAERLLDQAEQELYSSRLSTLQEISVEAQMKVRRARRAIEEAETKLRLIKRWSRDFDSEVEPLARRLDSFHDLVKATYPKGIAQLSETLRILEEYAQLGPGGAPPGAAAETEEPSSDQ